MSQNTKKPTIDQENEITNQLKLLNYNYEDLKSIRKLDDAINVNSNNIVLNKSDIEILKVKVKSCEKVIEELKLEHKELKEDINNVREDVKDIAEKAVEIKETVTTNHALSKKAFLDFRSRHMFMVIGVVVAVFGGLAATYIGINKSNNNHTRKQFEMVQEANKIHLQAVKKEFELIIKEKIDTVKSD